jgi:hypothetical protein
MHGSRQELSTFFPRICRIVLFLILAISSLHTLISLKDWLSWDQKSIFFTSKNKNKFLKKKFSRAKKRKQRNGINSFFVMEYVYNKNKSINLFFCIFTIILFVLNRFINVIWDSWMRADFRMLNRWFIVEEK